MHTNYGRTGKRRIHHSQADLYPQERANYRPGLQKREKGQSVSLLNSIQRYDLPMFTILLYEQTLGKGTYGEVSAAVHRENGQKRAIKVIARSKIKNWERFQTEVKILQTLVSCLPDEC